MVIALIAGVVVIGGEVLVIAAVGISVDGPGPVVGCGMNVPYTAWAVQRAGGFRLRHGRPMQHKRRHRQQHEAGDETSKVWPQDGVQGAKLHIRKMA